MSATRARAKTKKPILQSPATLGDGSRVHPGDQVLVLRHDHRREIGRYLGRKKSTERPLLIRLLRDDCVIIHCRGSELLAWHGPKVSGGRRN